MTSEEREQREAMTGDEREQGDARPGSWAERYASDMEADEPPFEAGDVIEVAADDPPVSGQHRLDYLRGTGDESAL